MRAKNEGNFRSVLKLLASNSKDTVTLEYLSHVQEIFSSNRKSKELTFLTPNFIKKVLSTTKTYIISEIVSTIDKRCGSKFSIQFHTSTDISMKNQCAIVIRYAEEDLRVHNRVICLLPICKAPSGKNLFEFLEQKLSEKGLSVHNVIGTCTDGASSMHSEAVGLSAHIQKKNDKHIYVWCASHRFNLAVESAVKIEDNISLIFDGLNKFSSFVRASPARMSIWKNVLHSLQSKYKNINVNMRPVADCDTRWWAKYKMTSHLVKNESHFIAVLLTLNDMKNSMALNSKQQKVFKII